MEIFSMIDIVGLLGLPFPKHNESSYNIHCPCCDDARDPRNKHLNINLRKNVFCCPKCGLGGGMFDMYAYFANVPRKDVYKELCEGEGCTEASDKAGHIWNEGVITTEATAEVDGVKTFTCTVCDQTKTETVEYVAVAPTQTEWSQAFAATIDAENLTYTRDQLVNGSSDGDWTLYQDGNKYMMEGYHHGGDELLHNCYFWVDSEEKTYHYTSATGETWTREEVGGITHVPALADTMMPFEALFSSFVFDAETQMFVLDSGVVMGFNMENVKVKIENGYVTYFTYTMPKDPDKDLDANYTQTIVFSNYGTTEVTLPSVAD